MLLTLLLACESDARPTPVAASSTVDASAASATTTASAVTPPERPWLERELERSDPRFAKWLADADALKLQILVTVVDPAASEWTRHELRVDAEYFYPASAIKLMLAVAALRTLNEAAAEPVDLTSLIRRCEPGRPGCEPPREDAEEKDAAEDDKRKHRRLRVGQEIRKMLSFSDNDSYNRLWDIVGHREANEALAALGFSSVRFHHRMNAPAERSLRTMRTVVLRPGDKALIFKGRNSDYKPPPTPAKQLNVGTAHNNRGKLVEEPMSFAEKNNASLHDLQRMLLSVLFPSRPEAAALELPEAQRELLIEAMTERFESDKHAAEHHPLTPGVLEVLPKDKVRYVGKSGRAYGFHLENAYIEHRDSKRALFVTVTVYANPNGVLNDDDYGYDETTRPLLAAVGKALAEALLVDR